MRASLRVWPDWHSLKDAVLEGNRLAWTAEWNNTSRDPVVGPRSQGPHRRIRELRRLLHAEVDRLLRSAQGCQSAGPAPRCSPRCSALCGPMQRWYSVVEAELLARVRRSVGSSGRRPAGNCRHRRDRACLCTLS